MFLNGAQRTAGIEYLQQHRRASAKEGAHHCLSLPAHVRRRQIDQCAGAVIAAKKCAAHAHVLHSNIAVRKECRFWRPRGAGGKNDQRAIVLAHVAINLILRLCPCAVRRLGDRRKLKRARNRLLRVHYDQMPNPIAFLPHGVPQRSKIEWTFHSQPSKPARPQNLQRSNDLGGRQTQIERSNNHA